MTEINDSVETTGNLDTSNKEEASQSKATQINQTHDKLNTEQEINEKKEPEIKAPEKYEFNMPDGFEELDQSAIDGFTPIAKELNLTQEQAQKLVDLHASQIKAQQEQFAKQREDWAKEVKADKEIGGNNLGQNIEHAKKALDKFGSPELVSLLESTGLGNHPDVVKFCVKIGRSFSEDSFVSSNAGAEEKTAAEVLYPSK